MIHRTLEAVAADVHESFKRRASSLSREEFEREYVTVCDNLTSLQSAGTGAKNLREEICDLAKQIVHSVPLGTSLPEQRLIVDKFRAAVSKLPKTADDAGVEAPQKPRAKQGSKSVQNTLNERVADSGKTGLPE